MKTLSGSNIKKIIPLCLSTNKSKQVTEKNVFKVISTSFVGPSFCVHLQEVGV